MAKVIERVIELEIIPDGGKGERRSTIHKECTIEKDCTEAEAKVDAQLEWLNGYISRNSISNRYIYDIGRAKNLAKVKINAKVKEE